jgi:hypothetical protein
MIFEGSFGYLALDTPFAKVVNLDLGQKAQRDKGDVGVARWGLMVGVADLG